MLNMRKSHLFFMLLLFPIHLLTAQTKPLPQAHSHNDYNRAIPLQSALEHGFTSVEADILYIYGELFVGHNMPDSANHSLPKLEEGYLKPLFERFQANKGAIYKGYEAPFYLWIDIKFESWKAYKLLKKQLEPYKEMLNYWDGSSFHKGAVTVILSGDRPMRMVEKEKLRLVTLDGRVADMSKGYTPELMPFISMNRRDVFALAKDGTIPTAEFRKLKAFVDRCHALGYKTRLWAIPEREEIWTQLLEAGIDLINTDDLKRLKTYFSK